jgi:hypothetical protein
MKTKVRELTLAMLNIEPLNSALGIELDIAADEMVWIETTLKDFWQVQQRLARLFHDKKAASE